MTACIFVGEIDILGDLETRLSNTRCISYRQIVLGSNRSTCDDFDFTFPLSMLLNGFLFNIHNSILH